MYTDNFIQPMDKTFMYTFKNNYFNVSSVVVIIEMVISLKKHYTKFREPFNMHNAYL